MHCLATADKHINDIRAIARQPPMKTIEGVLEAMFSVESAPAYFSTLKIETCSSETSVDFQRTTRRYIPEDRTPIPKRLRIHSCRVAVDTENMRRLNRKQLMKIFVQENQI
jgi:hypothetical protein